MWRAVLLLLVALATVPSPGAAQDPEITEVILPEIKAIGMTGRLNCTVINQLSTSPVYWMHVDTKMYLSKNDKIELEEKNNKIENGLPKYQVEMIRAGDKITYRIIVNRLERRDSGTYRCQIVVNGASVSPSKDGKMVVLIPPSISKRSTTNTLTVEQKGSATLTCNADGYPHPNITWVRVNGQLLPNGKLRHQNSTMVVTGVTARDRGIYRCLADNNVRPPDVFDVTLYINFRPVARAIQSSYGQASDRQFDVTLECRISGWPEAELRWYKKSKNGENSHIQNTDKHMINILLNHANILDQQERWFQLIIRTVEANDFGTYICEGSNKLGSSQAGIELFATSECQGPNCREEQRPEKSSSVPLQGAPPLLTAGLLVGIIRTILH